MTHAERLLKLLKTDFPANDDTSDGKMQLRFSEDAKPFDELAVLFGLAGYPRDTHARLKPFYDVVLVCLEQPVRYCLTVEGGVFDRFYAHWPPAWREYVRAVARGDTPEVLRLARELRVLTDDCVYPLYTYDSALDEIADDPRPIEQRRLAGV